MDTKNEIVRPIFKKIFYIGRMTYVKHDVPYKGGPVPLLKNENREKYQQLGSLSFAFLFIFAADLI